MIIVSHTQGLALADISAASQRAVFDTEVYGPSESLALGTRYLNTAPLPFQVKEGVLISIAQVQDAVDLAANPFTLRLWNFEAVDLLNSPLVISQETTFFPHTVFLDPTLPSRSRMFAQIEALSYPYGLPPLGLRIAFCGSWLPQP